MFLKKLTPSRWVFVACVATWGASLTGNRPFLKEKLPWGGSLSVFVIFYVPLQITRCGTNSYQHRFLRVEASRRRCVSIRYIRPRRKECRRSGVAVISTVGCKPHVENIQMHTRRGFGLPGSPVESVPKPPWPREVSPCHRVDAGPTTHRQKKTSSPIGHQI